MAASNGALILSHPNNPQKDIVSIYLSDVAGVSLKFSRTGKADANSPDNLVFSNWTGIEDVVIAAATGQTTTTICRNDIVVGVLLNAQHLASVTTRPEPGIIFSPGQKLTSYQVA
jgi:phage-related tail fiber protein